MFRIGSNTRKLLLSTALATGNTLLLATGIAVTAAPTTARADGCQLYNVNGNITCYLNSNGGAGTPAQSSGSDPIFHDQNGYTGGPGGQAADINLDVEFNPHLYDYSTRDSHGNVTAAVSPVNAVSVGGDGAQGSDATGGGFDKVGGNGGNGGQAGDVTVTVGTDVIGTSEDTSIGISAATIISLGGVGGAAGKGNLSGMDGNAAPGGNGGTINATLDGFFQGNFYGIYVSGQGGEGGRGRDWGAGYNSQGADATLGVGGNGGPVTVTFLNAGGDVNTNGFIGNYGNIVQSVGGTGGNGGTAEDVDGSQGGAGGQGGNAGNVSVTVGTNVRMVETSDDYAALHVLSQGGQGGQGSSTGGSGGNAGAGGNAGDVTLTFNAAGGIIAANGTYAPGVLVQSLGGNGGDGGTPSKYVIGPNGGAGSDGGTAGTVTVTGSGLHVTTGVYVDDALYEGSPGLLAQSIGGGGGGGGSAKGIFSVGGDGGQGINGNTVSVSLQSTVETFGFGSDGLAAQSIGGGGGKAGDATGTSAGFNYVVGGSGGGGGGGYDVSLTSLAGSVIKTHGQHSPGLLAQSIGGGGGQGGSAYSSVTSAGLGVSMAVGGSGGKGGDACYQNQGGGDPTPTCTGTSAENDGRITTDGSDSYGILAQSIGGGGGAGGASTAKAHVYAAEDVAISITASLGGSGGQAGSGGLLSATNTGLITTTGEGAVGVLAQSVGGGGGAGGDASSASTASGEYAVSSSLTFGGKGGTAGNGGNATGTNSGGVILTTGESAAGLLVQSVGGGGGVGGGGDAKASSSGGDDNLSATLTMGGSGGSGGDGYGATASNIGGSIITLGDGAFGIGAQSIGGGGGAGGGAAGSTKGTYSASVTMGANGGNGGNTYHIDGNGNEIDGVTVLNDAKSTIVTFGADANGIIAQSIGGGGGVGGKASTNLGTQKSDNAGGNSGSNASTAIGNATSAYDSGGSAALNSYLGLNNAVTFVGSLLSSNTGAALTAVSDDPDSDLDSLAQEKGDTDDSNEASSISLKVALGAKGGSGGSAGLVTVTNNGEIATLGADSDAILAQAIGGGGGKGGASSTASTTDYSGNLSVGGGGGGGGYGGQVVITNTGTIYTKGSLAAGIVGESIAGGGGIGGASASSIKSGSSSGADDGAFQSIALSLGGDGGSSFDSGQVRVTSSGAISTAAHDATGIIAQSITGGGGIVKTLATDLEGAGGSASATSTDYQVNLKFGGSSGYASGGSGLVNVTTQTGGTITTKGDDAFGILAQSISGGGGIELGGKPNGSAASDFFGSGKRSGNVNNDGVNDPNSGNSGLFVTVGDNITTSGAGAVGVFAQSVGGSGGIAGDVGHTMQLSMMGSASQASDYVGNGGAILVTVNAGATISTTGGNAPAIIAQSVGGGGGWITNQNYAYIGSTGGTGNGGDITINVQGAVSATGPASAGIFAQSTGGADNSGSAASGSGSGGTISITIGNANSPCTNSYAACAASVFGGNGFGAIAASVYVRNGSSGNVVNNYGVINTNEPNDGYAFYFDNTTNNKSSSAALTVNNYGIVTGNTNIAGNFHTYGNGTYAPLSTVDLNGGTLTNDGTLDIQGTRIGTSTITGNYAGAGKVVFDADFVQGVGDKLVVNGKATISGSIEVDPKSIRNARLPLISATGGLTVDPALTSAPSTTTGSTVVAATSGTSLHQPAPLALQLFTYKFDSDGTTLYATPQAQFAAQASGLGGARQAVAGHLQTMFDSGELFDTGYTALANLQSPAAYAATLESLTGQALGGIAAYRYQASRRFVSDVNGACDTQTDTTCTWARVQAGKTTQGATTDALGYDALFQIYEMGAQTRIADGLYLGGALAYEHSTLRDADRTSRIHGSSMLGALGLRYRTGALEIVGSVDGGYGWYTSGRQIIVGSDSATADAKPRLWNIGVDLSASYLVPLGKSSYFKPFAEVRGSNVHSNAFTETSTSEFALDVMSQSDFAVSGTIGASLGTTIDAGGGLRMKPFVTAAVEFAGDTDWQTSARFTGETAGTAPFTVQTRSPGTFGRFGIGADLASGANFDLTLSYNPEVGSHYTTQQGVARLTYRF